MVMWVVSSFWLLQIKLVWILVNKSLCEYKLSFPLGKYLVVEWLGCMVGIFWLFKTLPNIFPNGCSFLYSTSNVWDLKLLHILTNSWYGQSVILAILKLLCSSSSLWYTLGLYYPPTYMSSSPYWNFHTLYFTTLPPLVYSPLHLWILSSPLSGSGSPLGYCLCYTPFMNASCGQALITCTWLPLFPTFSSFLSHMPIL